METKELIKKDVSEYDAEIEKVISDCESRISFYGDVIVSLDHEIANLSKTAAGLRKEIDNPNKVMSSDEIASKLSEIETDIRDRHQSIAEYTQMMASAKKDAKDAKNRMGDKNIACALSRDELTALEISIIEDKIGYLFKDKSLLLQAFTRKSYANEHHTPHNEVLEFYGDSIVGVAVTKYMFGRYSNYKVGQAYISTRTEGELSKTREKRVSSTFLASRIRALGLEQYLLMGKGDIKLAIEDVESVLEDLFESIVGAVFVDNNGDLNKSVEFATSLLSLEEDGASIEDVEHRFSLLFNSDVYIDTDITHDDSVTLRACGRGFNSFKTVVEVKGDGLSNAIDEMNNVIDRFEKHKLCDYVNTLVPTRERAINIIQEMEQKGVISSVNYEFEEKEEEGVIRWNCLATADSPFDANRGYCSDSWAPGWFENKKEAKKDAALVLLCDVLFQHGIYNLINRGKITRRESGICGLIEEEGIRTSYEHATMKYMEENGLTLVDFLKLIQ